jgi:hypothetical protein
MTARATRPVDARVPRTARDEKAPPLTAGHADIPWRDVATALAQKSPRLLTTSVRDYARSSRAHGATVQEVVKVLEDLVRDAAPESTTLAKQSCEVAEWAIQAYFEVPASMHVAIWGTEPVPPEIYSPFEQSKRDDGALA